MTAWTQLYKDDRIWGCDRYILTAEPRELMDIPQEVMKSVVFVGCKDLSGNEYFYGTAVLISRAHVGGVTFCYFVTARHVIDKIKEKGLVSILLRMNMKSGNAKWVATKLEDWVLPSDPSVDVAVLPYVLTPEVDHLPFPIFNVLDKQVTDIFNVGVGNDVFITGLFHHHKGRKNNIPIVRVGNIAAMPTEKVETKEFGPIDAYLIEARSIGGLSGSPVFLSLGINRSVGGFPLGHYKVYLLGIVHGHFDAKKGDASDDAVLIEDAAADEKLNVGIAVVVPIKNVLETITQSEIADQEDKVVRKKEVESNLPAMDSGEFPAEDATFTQSDFEQALRKVSRRIEPSESDAKKK